MIAKNVLRAVSLDVTGTLLRYRGHIGDIYGIAPTRFGYPEIPDEEVHKAFKKAYRECCEQYPCFGHAAKLNSKEWWRTCVRRTFELAGQRHPEPVSRKIFQYIYSAFGSSRAYELFPDSPSFVHWARAKGLTTGILSNATDRYGDSVLPMLGLHEDLDFMVISYEVGVEKPDRRIFEIAMAEAGVQHPHEMLHIGDSYNKDYLPAMSMGMHAVLLDRFNTKEALEWRKASIPVFNDLDSVREWMISKGLVGANGVPLSSTTTTTKEPASNL